MFFLEEGEKRPYPTSLRFQNKILIKFIYVYICVYIYIYIYICMYVYMYIYVKYMQS